MIRAVVMMLVSLVAADAVACGRCGFRGRLCRFAVVDSHHAVAVAPYVAPQPQTLILQNNYNAPNGAAALIAPQGGTVYGLQAAAAPYRLDPDAVLRQAAELTRGAQQLAATGLQGYSQTASLALTLSASQPAIQAAAITAPLAVQAPRQQTMTLTQRTDGTWEVKAADTAAQPAVAPASKDDTMPSDEPRPQALAGVGTLVQRHCGSCHGLQKPDPKGGLYYDLGHQLDCRSAMAAVKAVSSGKMPKGTQLSAEDRAGLIAELSQLGVAE